MRKILPDSHGVLSLCPDEVRYTTKQGLKIFSARFFITVLKVFSSYLQFLRFQSVILPPNALLTGGFVIKVKQIVLFKGFWQLNFFGKIKCFQKII